MIKNNIDLKSGDVIVGECKGLSAVFDSFPSAAMEGCLIVHTEHGYLYVPADSKSIVVANYLYPPADSKSIVVGNDESENK